MSVIAKIRAQYKAAGLNENGKGGMKPTPPPKAQAEKAEAPKSVLPDTLFEGIPSQTDNPVTKTDASKPQ